MITKPLWAQTFVTASFNGIVFQTLENSVSYGRRTALHEYPFRDTPYVEDLGKAKQEISIKAFIHGDDVYTQRDALMNACAQAGPGTLVHPTLGTMQANLTNCVFVESVEGGGNVVSVELKFVVADNIVYARLYPLIGTNALQTVPSSVANVISAAANDFLDDVSDFYGDVSSALSDIGSVLAPIESVISTVASFAEICISAAGSVIGAISAISGLTLAQPDLWLGTYSVGTTQTPTVVQNTGNLSTVDAISAATTNAIANLCTNRAAVVSANASMVALATNEDSIFPQSVSTTIESVRACINDPQDQIKALVPLLSFTPTSMIPSSSPISAAISTAIVATGNLCRSCVLASISNAVYEYNPVSSTDCQNLINTLAPLFDNEITVAGDNDNLQSYLQLKTLRNNVLAYLRAQGANLPALETFTFNTALPSLVLSQMLYQTASRSNELIVRSGAQNPLFCPTTFQALSS